MLKTLTHRMRKAGHPSTPALSRRFNAWRLDGSRWTKPSHAHRKSKRRRQNKQARASGKANR